MTGYESHQDPRLLPPDYWHNDTDGSPPPRSCIIEKYRDAAIKAIRHDWTRGFYARCEKEAIETLIVWQEVNNETENLIVEYALSIAQEQGETWSSD